MSDLHQYDLSRAEGYQSFTSFSSMQLDPTLRDEYESVWMRFAGNVYSEEFLSYLDSLAQTDPQKYKEYVRFTQRRFEQSEYEFSKEVGAILTGQEEHTTEAPLICRLESLTTNQELIARLQEDFATSDYLVHTTSTQNGLRILLSGEILSAQSSKIPESSNASHGGTLGISFNCNEVSLLYGTHPRHFISFMVSPRKLIEKGMQLGVPSSASKGELQALPAEINFQEYSLALEQIYFLFPYINFINNQEDSYLPITARLKDAEELSNKCKECIDNNLSQLPIEEVDIIFGRLYEDFVQKVGLDDTDPYKLKVFDYISSMMSESNELIAFLENKEEEYTHEEKLKIIKAMLELSEKALSKIAIELKKVRSKDVEIAVSDMWLFVSERDLEHVQKAIKISGKSPRGIIVYPSNVDQEPRIATIKDLEGDHDKMQQIVDATFKSASIPDKVFSWYSLLPNSGANQFFQPYAGSNFYLEFGIVNKIKSVRLVHDLSS